MTCSVGVCQCQGIEQPAVPLKMITDGPLEGSPLSTAIVMHEGNPAMGVSLFSDSLRRTPISAPLAMNRHVTINPASLIALSPNQGSCPATVYPSRRQS